MKSKPHFLPRDAEHTVAPSAAPELVTGLLATALADIGVVSRELSLSIAMRERIRRALDCLQCAEAILETGVKGEADSCFCDQMRGEAWSQVVGLVREYLETWPDDLLAMLVELRAESCAASAGFQENASRRER
jgi:hypothetical protein